MRVFSFFSVKMILGESLGPVAKLRKKMSLAGKTVSMSDSLKKDPGIALLGTSEGHLFKHKELCL
jgi:hypothetical protein